MTAPARPKTIPIVEDSVLAARYVSVGTKLGSTALFVEWKKRFTEIVATARKRSHPSVQPRAGIINSVSPKRRTLVPTRIERRENRSMNGPVNGPTMEKGSRVTAKTFVTCEGVLAADTSKIRTEARAT